MLMPDCMNVLLQEDCSKPIIPGVENLHLKRLFSNALDTTIKTGGKNSIMSASIVVGIVVVAVLLLLWLHESKLSI